MKTIYFGKMEFLPIMCVISKIYAEIHVPDEVLDDVIDFFIEGGIYQEYVVVEDYFGTILFPES